MTQITKILKIANELSDDNKPIKYILSSITNEYDALVKSVIPPSFSPSVIATGGFGREEMYPHSDIDLLIVLQEKHTQNDIQQAEKLVGQLWNQGAKVGHSIRTLSQCLEDAKADVHFFTALLESRCLYGNNNLLDKTIQSLKSNTPYKAAGFLTLKIQEQNTRHEQYEDNLEPNIKNSPGGMRDIHTLNWLSLFYQYRFDKKQELDQIQQAYDFLAMIRLDLHLHHRKPADVLSFEDQKRLSHKLGYVDDAKQLAVEKFMQDHYRHNATIDYYNELYLQSFGELFNRPNKHILINDQFAINGNFIELTDPALLNHQPKYLLDAFIYDAEKNELGGFTSDLIRSLHQCRKHIGKNFLSQPKNAQRFLKLIEQPLGVTRLLSRLNRYDLLGAMIPIFDDIRGQMQFDLFHRKTVDQHTIATIKECRKLKHGLYLEQMPFATKLCQSLPNMRVLILAALYHDIGKGRGVDHSEWGSEAALAFCKNLNLPETQSELVSFLVAQHLTLSQTSQKMDISDPEVIKRFTKLVDTNEKLDYLYVLTVADIRATNAELFNSWKDMLLQNLYHAAQKYLLSAELVIEHQVPERIEALQETIPKQQNILNSFPKAYFAHFKDEDIKWQLNAINENKEPVIALRFNPKHKQLECLVYLHRQYYLFAKLTAAIANSNLSVAEANYFISGDNHAIYHLVVLNKKNRKASKNQAAELREKLEQAIAEKTIQSVNKRRSTGKIHAFNIKTAISFQQHKRRNETILDINCSDRHGLLAYITKIFAEHEVILHRAKIVTFGEQVEDRFVLSTLTHEPLSEETCTKLKTALSSL